MAVLQLRDDLTAEQREDRANELMEEFHIEHLRDSMGQAPSGGERRRRIARALPPIPNLVLLDEPLPASTRFPLSTSNAYEHLRDSGPRRAGSPNHNVRGTAVQNVPIS